MFEPFIPEPPRNYNLSDWKYEVISKQIEEFQNNLDEEHEIALQLASFGTSILMQVTSISYQNPDLFYFYGFVNGKYSQLIQHSSQLNFLLTSIEREDKSKPARRIGFELPNN